MALSMVTAPSHHTGRGTANLRLPTGSARSICKSHHRLVMGFLNLLALLHMLMQPESKTLALAPQGTHHQAGVSRSLEGIFTGIA